MIKIKRKKVVEKITEAVLFEADASTAQQPAVATLQPDQQNTQQAADTSAGQPLDAATVAIGVNNFMAGIANYVKEQCSTQNLGTVIPELVEIGKMDQFKQAIDAVNAPIKAIASANVSAEQPDSINVIFTQYGNLTKSLADLIAAVSAEAEKQKQSQLQLLQTPADTSTAQQA